MVVLFLGFLIIVGIIHFFYIRKQKKLYTFKYEFKIKNKANRFYFWCFILLIMIIFDRIKTFQGIEDLIIILFSIWFIFDTLQLRYNVVEVYEEGIYIGHEFYSHKEFSIRIEKERLYIQQLVGEKYFEYDIIKTDKDIIKKSRKVLNVQRRREWDKGVR